MVVLCITYFKINVLRKNNLSHDIKAKVVSTTRLRRQEEERKAVRKRSLRNFATYVKEKKRDTKRKFLSL